MTLCTSSFASLICSSTIEMSIVGLPGMPGALAVHAVLAHHRERVRQQIHAPPPAGRDRGPSWSRASRARRVLAEYGLVVHDFLGGCAGRISTRLGRLRDGWAIRSTITSATSSGINAHSDFVFDSPPKPVFTDPGSTYATRMPS